METINNNQIIDNQMVPIKYEHFSHYSIDRTGKVYTTTDRTKKKNLLPQPIERKAHPNKNSKYLQVMLQNSYKDIKPTLYYVHRLVAEHFIPNPLNLPQVNHIDFDKNNNHVDNLEWASISDNIQHSVKNNPNYCITNMILDDEKRLNDGLSLYKRTKDVNALATFWKCSTISCYKIFKLKNIQTKNRKRK